MILSICLSFIILIVCFDIVASSLFSVGRNHKDALVVSMGTTSSSFHLYHELAESFNIQSEGYVKLIEKNVCDTSKMFMDKKLDIMSSEFIPKRNSSISETPYCFPVYANALGIVYNIPVHNHEGDDTQNKSIETLNLSVHTLIGIYNKTIQYWDSPQIQELNPGLQLPHEQITVLYRSYKSGTTWLLSTLFSEYSEYWKEKYGSGTDIDWETEHPFIIASQREMIRYISEKPYSIGYVSMQSLIGHAVEEGINIQVASIMREKDMIASSPTPVNIKLALNEWLNSTMEAILNQDIASLSSASMMKEIINAAIKNPLILQEAGYPLTSFSFLCSHLKYPISGQKVAKHLYRFISYSFKHIESQAQLPVAVLPSTVGDFILHHLEEELIRSFRDEDRDNRVTILILVIGISFLFVSIIGMIALSVFSWICKFHKRKGDDEHLPLLFRNEGKRYEAVFGEDIESEEIENGLELLELIGEGPFSETFFGRFHFSPCAIKRYYLDPQDSKIMEHFLQEVEILQHIHHPNIIHYLASFTNNPPNLYLVTEYCSVGDLEDLLQTQNLPISMETKVRMALEVARGLYFLHSQKPPILHRNLKLSNIFVSEGMTLKIGDFGCAVTLDCPKNLGTSCGSMEVSAPEVLLGQAHSQESDVYSFCIVLWQIFTRQKLFEGLEAHEILDAVLTCKSRPPLDLECIPQEIRGILKQGLVDNFHKRPTMREIVEALEIFHDELGLLNASGNNSKVITSPVPVV